MTKPTPKSDIRDTFREQLEKLAESADSAHLALLLIEQRKWFHPELKGWGGDLFDLVGMSKSFDRSANHKDFLDALSSAEAPGAIGDLASAQLQGDWLASLERAYRQRHSSAIRGRLHAAARLLGHGHEKGPLRQGVMKWLEGIVQTTKGGK